MNHVVALALLIFLSNMSSLISINNDDACTNLVCVCVSNAQARVIKVTCANDEVNKCYENVKCEIQLDGKCGFNKSDALNNCLMKASNSNLPVVLPECRPTGCSKEICSDMDQISQCVYKDEYRCLLLTKCQRDNYGNCEWEENEKYLECLKKYTSL